MINTKQETLSFNTIYKTYYNYVFNMIMYKTRNQCTSEEITNNVFVKVNVHQTDFNPEKAKIETWLHEITNNCIIDYWRTINKKQTNTINVSSYVHENGNEVFQFTDNNSESDMILINAELKEKIILAIQNLKPKYKQIAELFFLHELTYNEIIDIVQLPRNTVKVMILRCRLMLQDDLKDLKKSYNVQTMSSSIGF